MTETTYGVVYEIACPKCGAEPGLHCRSGNGKRLSKPHLPRYTAFAKRVEKTA